MMAAVSRRRRFIILLIICCISFFVFGWYTKSGESGTINDPHFTELNESPSDEILEFSEKSNSLLTDSAQTSTYKEISRSPNTLILKNRFSKLVKFEKFQHSNEAKLRHPIVDYELFSGPMESTEEPFTLPYQRYSDAELEFSGPMEYNDVEARISGLRQSDMELENSGPTEYEKETTKSITVLDIDKVNVVQLSEKAAIKKDKHLKLTLKATTPAFAVTKPVKNPGQILDTPACKIPKLNPWDPTIIKLYEKKDPYKCPGPPLFLKAQPDGSIAINETVLEIHYNLTLEDIDCYYRTIHRKHEDPGNVRENDFVIGNNTDLEFGLPLNEDYVAVTCKLRQNETQDYDFEQYFPLARLKPEIEKERNKILPPEPRLNVILVGIDSISKLNYLRHFPRTRAFLKEKMTPFDMKGYTKVGDNTFPNLVPLLTGHFVEYYWNESMKNSMYFDHLDLIWKEYAKKGFRTFYAEDSPHTGTFNYLKRGFYDPPTDYYFRPLALALEQSNVRKKSKQHCLNSQIETDIIYDYLRDFLQAMGPRPYIAFAMVSTITHDYLNKAGWADEPTFHLLESLHNNGALNNSMLVFFSDHGLRFGPIRETYIGKFEERMPFMFLHFPKWFLNQNPHIAKNLHDNQERLITLFDIHATMLHLLDLKRDMTPEEKASITLGSSLMKEITVNRTCEDANILPHWCPCQTFEEVPPNDRTALKCAQAIVDDINTKLKPYKGSCAVLEIERISDARLGQANDLVLRFLRHENVVVNRTVIYGDKVKTLGDYMITLTTKPGGAVFEGTVRYDSVKASYTVLGISRINLYGNQSRCVDSQKMKIFCYCIT